VLQVCCSALLYDTICHNSPLLLLCTLIYIYIHTHIYIRICIYVAGLGTLCVVIIQHVTAHLCCCSAHSRASCSMSCNGTDFDSSPHVMVQTLTAHLSCFSAHLYIDIHTCTHIHSRASCSVWCNDSIYHSSPLFLLCTLLGLAAVCVLWCSVWLVTSAVVLHTSRGRCFANHAAPHCNIIHHTAPHYTTLQHTVTYCNALHHTATPQQTATHTASVDAPHTCRARRLLCKLPGTPLCLWILFSSKTRLQ